jgi:hypothetical protein
MIEYKKNSAICYLSKSDEKTIINLENSLYKLYLNYKHIYDSNVIIFIEYDFPNHIINKLKGMYSNLNFQFIKLMPSKHFDINNIKFEDGRLEYTIGYRHMCQFFFSEIFQYLYDYDWYMRLDTDSFIESPIDYNLFNYLENNNKVYGYTAELAEWPPVVIGMGEFFINLVRNKNINAKFFNKLIENERYNLRQIYNNFEIIKLSYITSESIQSLIKEINESGNIYMKRWGDSPLRTFILSLTIDKSQIYKFNNFDYIHDAYSRINNIEYCKYDGYQQDLFKKWKIEGWLDQ